MIPFRFFSILSFKISNIDIATSSSSLPKGSPSEEQIVQMKTCTLDNAKSIEWGVCSNNSNLESINFCDGTKYATQNFSKK